MFMAALLTMAETETTKRPLTGSRTWSLIMREYFLATTKKDILPFVTVWMALEGTELN